jgi:hypothetical protein
MGFAERLERANKRTQKVLEAKEIDAEADAVRLIESAAEPEIR